MEPRASCQVTLPLALRCITAGIFPSVTRRPAIAAFLQVSGAWRGDRRLVMVPTHANDQPAFGCYLAEPDEAVASPAGIMVLTLHADRIRGMTRFFLADDLLPRFGLPPTSALD